MIASSYALTTPQRTRGAFVADDYARQRRFFVSRPDLAATPLRLMPRLATATGLGEVWVKDESSRFGLPAFKAVGVEYAVASLLADGRLTPGATLVCASAGNHGRAVARAARLAGCPARVFMARTAEAARVEAIRGEGAIIVQEAATYDAAVRQMAEAATQHGWTIVSDTAWPGYQDIPRRIMVGYTRLVDEIASAWPHHTPPDALLVPGGVGGILGAVASACRWTWGPTPAVLCIEPFHAACLQASARAGHATRIDGALETTMAGLQCGVASTLGFDAADGIVSAWLGIDDEWAMAGMRLLAQTHDGEPIIRANASGAAALGGLQALAADPALRDVRTHLGLGPTSRAIVFVTEGVTDPDAFARVVPAP